MARKYLVSIDLSKNEIQNAVVQVLASAPATPAEGQVYYNSVDKVAYIYNGSAWKKMEENVAIDFGESGDISASAPGDSAAAGSTGEVADAGHVHARESFATSASTQAFGDSAAAGSSGSPSRGDHKHAIPAHDGAAHGSISISSLAAPTGNLAMSNYKITGLGTPTADGDAATKAYVDSSAAGLDIKQSVRAATTADITLSGTQTIDGVSVIAGDRVLVKNQSTAADNGIYVVAAGSWTRATDFDSSADASPGSFCFVEEGTTLAETGWVLSTNGPITLGTTSLTFTQFNASVSYLAGNGLTLTSGTFAVGAGTGITVNADDVAIDTSVVARKYATDLSGSLISYTVTHNLGTRDVHVTVYDTTTYATVECDVANATTNTVTVGFASAPSSGAYRCVVVG